MNIDPTTITSYKHAVKYLVARVAVDHDFLVEIKGLVQDQAALEARRIKERTFIGKRTTSRAQGKMQLDGILQMVGGQGSGGQTEQSGSDIDTGLTIERELEIYDKATYELLRQFGERCRQELKSLNVPLFCMDCKLETTDLEKDQKKVIDLLWNLVT